MTQPPEGPSVTVEQTIADLRQQLAECRAERDEALARETATAEVLGVINPSPGNLTPVFEAMIERATRLCEADFGTLWTFDGDRFHPAVGRGYLDLERVAGSGSTPWRGATRPSPRSALGQIIAGEKIVHVIDVAADPGYQSDDIACNRTAAAGARSSLAVGLRKKWHAARGNHDRAEAGSALFRQTHRAPAEFRRAGGYRNRERAPNY